MNREDGKFDLVNKLEIPVAQVVEFPMNTEEPPPKSTSGLMDKLKRKRDEEFGKGE